jgi:hypothetical protein
MTRILALLLTLTVAACGSASTAGPKTTNPPLKKDPPKADPKADADEKPPMEVEGRTLKLNQLACRITLSDIRWKAAVGLDGKGVAHLSLTSPDLEGEMDMHGQLIPGVSAQKIAEAQQAMMAKEPDLKNVSAPLDEGKGRWAVTVELTIDGNARRGYLAVIAHPVIPDAYLIAMGIVAPAKADEFLKELRATLDTLAPL